MRVGMIVASLSRRGGGVSLAVRELTRALVRMGVEVIVFAGEDAFSRNDSNDWDASVVHVLPISGSKAFGYQPSLFARMKAERLDCVHLHGLWMYGSVATQRMARAGWPTVVSPHGMLDPWALNNSASKKRIAWAAFERSNLWNASVLHALNRAELEAFKAVGLRQRVEIVPNGIDPQAFRDLAPKAEWESLIPLGSRRLLFLGRLHPKKGVFELIEGFSAVARRAELENWHLVMAGWDDGGHLSALKALAEKNGVSHRIHFIGPVFGDMKARALQTAHGFILPSFSEGLPIAVLEAWAAGVPTIISRQCNLDIAFAENAALMVSPESDSIGKKCLTLATMPAAEIAEMACRAKMLVDEQFSWDIIARNMVKIYGSLERRPNNSIVRRLMKLGPKSNG